MKKKDTLVKIAFTALLATTLPYAVHAASDESSEFNSGSPVGTLLAAHNCGAASCAGQGAGSNKNGNIAMDDANSQMNSPHSTTNQYNTMNKATDPANSTNPNRNLMDSNSYNTNRGYNTSPTYQDAYNTNSPTQAQSTPSQYQTPAQSSSMNSQYNQTNPDYNRTPSYTSQSNTNKFTADATTDSAAFSSTVNQQQQTMTESDLLKQLNPQGRAIYQSLDQNGKTLALQLAAQNTYKDKNLAIKEAQRRSNEAKTRNQTNSSTNASY